jgi:hypothetical protein
MNDVLMPTTLPAPKQRPARAKAPAKAYTKPDERRPRTNRRSREFSRVLQAICDEIGSLLISGGNRAAIDGLITAATLHHYSRDWPTTLYLEGEIPEKVRNQAKELGEYWRGELNAAILSNRRAPEPERQESSDVSGLVRATWQENLKDCFSQFLKDASPIEVRLMVEILDTWKGMNGGAQARRIALAECFNYSIGRNRSFIECPFRFEKKAYDYILALYSVERHELELKENANEEN